MSGDTRRKFGRALSLTAGHVQEESCSIHGTVSHLSKRKDLKKTIRPPIIPTSPLQAIYNPYYGPFNIKVIKGLYWDNGKENGHYYSIIGYILGLYGG